MNIPTDEMIKAQVEERLSGDGINAYSRVSLLKALSAHFKTDLKSRKAVVKKFTDDYMRSRPYPVLDVSKEMNSDTKLPTNEIPTDEMIKAQVEERLSGDGLNKYSRASLLKALCNHFKTDLKNRKKFIKQVTDNILLQRVDEEEPTESENDSDESSYSDDNETSGDEDTEEEEDEIGEPVPKKQKAN
eukprot:TRINITY_DN67399_c6_g7_i1.p2 TRINITY_DN67399_c6_g7~~TRINITY_DN67399_c6_g7_i1.p2  ORF type:complete len:188 (+),score=6.13 TRINITY_DN67399_c6_g7_i1:208-771(+)